MPDHSLYKTSKTHVCFPMPGIGMAEITADVGCDSSLYFTQYTFLFTVNAYLQVGHRNYAIFHINYRVP